MGTNAEATALRRAQILDATIRVIAREGVHGLSFAKVKDEAGISSTRLVSYHFGARDALLAETLHHVLGQAAAFMGPRIAAESTIRGKIAAYVRSNFAFLARDVDYARAVVALAGAVSAGPSSNSLALLEDGFRAGQATGELRDFDVAVMAISLRGAMDANIVSLAASSTDWESAAEQIVVTFDRAIAAQPQE
ncbi:TetR family transcriptional regulator [Microbacterium sp. NPDC057659]|uniref:TetR family transcriptional regulator n=1 Tax=Microbacterium sp. NPDC057659 TaxID=3346198 RepID=UPI0036706796